MHREDKFVMSHRGYAVDLSSFRIDEIRTGWKGEYACATVNAVWFRRKNGVSQAVAGELWDSQWDIPKDAVQFLEQHEDGRYGGRPFARWDGTGVWYAGQDPEENTRHLELLRTVLDAYHADPKAPDLSARWSRWWRF